MRKEPPIEAFELFQTLLTERSLSAASARLGLPVSTASRFLADLRDFFDDPLFTRCREGLIATHKATELGRRVDRLLAEYAAVTRPEVFDLSSVRREVRIGCVDNAPFSLFPNLVRQVRQKAPAVTLSFLPIHGDRFEMLRHRDLDFVIMPMQGTLQEGFHALELGVNRYVLVCGERHPLCAAPGPLADDQVLAYPFVDIILGPGRQGAHQRLLRQVRFPDWAAASSAVKTYFFLPFIGTVADTDLLMVLPERTAKRLTRSYGIRILPTLTQGLIDQPHIIWHDVTHRDSLMQWVRAMFLTSSDASQSER
jgi:DNA-binding transcriptional LysR family regulator